jgi:alcohol dehydrogenase class IV
VVAAVGGGSVMDCAKAVAAIARNEGPVENYVEGVGTGRELAADPIPMIAAPTTSGTGAEMTRNAVIADRRRSYKKSLRDPRMIPAAALIDPALTCSCPRAVTAGAGMDAVTQLIEPCISVKRRPGPTALALRALRHAGAALPRCCTDPQDLAAREAMALVGAVSGICLANAGLGLVHGIASGLGAWFPVPHGMICGVLLPHALHYNRDACPEELGAALGAFLHEDEVGSAVIDRGIAAVQALNDEIGLPPDLKHLGLTEAQVRAVAEASMGSSMSGNPIPMDPDRVYAFLRPLT